MYSANVEVRMLTFILFFRCKKVLVVISAASLESDLFHFQLKVAHSMSPGMSGMLCYSSFFDIELIYF